MDRKMYRYLTDAQFRGRKVKSRFEMRNGRFVIPAGTIFTIVKKFGGFSLISDSCPTCGVAVSISKVQPFDIDLI